MTCLFPPLPSETRRILDCLPRLIDEVFPIPKRFHAGLKWDVAELSRLLTSGREERSASYLGKPALLSAYLRYFFPWNIYRLCRLFTDLPLNLKPGDSINDFGAGPLTLAASLWISRPELRTIPLEFRCLDKTGAVMEAGEKIFKALASTGNLQAPCPWIIKRIRGEIRRNGTLSVEIRGKPAALSSAVNIYNELFWHFSPFDTEGFKLFSEKQAKLLSSLTDESGSILVVEPGIPHSGRFISLIRKGFMGEGRMPLSPCTHHQLCPFQGREKITGRGKAKWCHFAFDTEDAPEELHKLSLAAKIPKERAVLSFMYAGPIKQVKKRTPEQGKNEAVNIRILSDSFPLGNSRQGRYGCSECGLVLVTGSSESLRQSPPGTLETLPVRKDTIDGKSGAFLAYK